MSSKSSPSAFPCVPSTLLAPATPKETTSLSDTISNTTYNQLLKMFMRNLKFRGLLFGVGLWELLLPSSFIASLSRWNGSRRKKPHFKSVLAVWCWTALFKVFLNWLSKSPIKKWEFHNCLLRLSSWWFNQQFKQKLTSNLMIYSCILMC